MAKNDYRVQLITCILFSDFDVNEGKSQQSGRIKDAVCDEGRHIYDGKKQVLANKARSVHVERPAVEVRLLIKMQSVKTLCMTGTADRYCCTNKKRKSEVAWSDKAAKL